MHSGFRWGKAYKVLALPDITEDAITPGKRPPWLYAHEWRILADTMPYTPPWRIALNLDTTPSLGGGQHGLSPDRGKDDRVMIEEAVAERKSLPVSKRVRFLSSGIKSG